MRKISGWVLILIVLVVIFSTTIAAFAKVASNVNPLVSLQAHPDFILPGQASPSPNVTSKGYTPSQLRKAYGLNRVSNQGGNMTVAIVDACGNPSAQSDLNKYDKTYGLPATTLKVVTPEGPPCSDPSGWGLETDLDIQMVHAIAPRAKVVLEEAISPSFSDLLNAVQDAYTNQGATIVSMSFGGNEFSDETSTAADGILSTGNAQGISFTASSGDSSCATQYPAASPYVTAVGGTSLVTKKDGTYISETAWNGSGGGISQYEANPPNQNGFNTNTMRSIPDVAMVADPITGVMMYDSQQGGFFVVGGTSVGAPIWAGILAISNHGRVLSGKGTMQNADIQLYNIASNSSQYSSDYHDIAAGTSGGSCTAGTGYDLVTGLGSPASNDLVPDLIAAG